MKTNSNKIGIAARLLRAGAIAAIIFSMAACDTGFQHVNKPGQNPGTGSGNAITKDDLANIDRSGFDVPPHVHSWGSWSSDTATSTSNGTASRTCSAPGCPIGTDIMTTSTGSLPPSAFTLINGDTEYSVSTSGLSGNATIPAFSKDVDGNYLPVTTIALSGTSTATITILNDTTDAFGNYYLTAINAGPLSTTSITVDAMNNSFSIDSGILYNTGKTTLIRAPTGTTVAPVLTGVTAISDEAFKDTAISTITLPNGLVSIGASAFAGTDITTISIPSSVTTISTGAFDGSTSLATIVVDAGNNDYSDDTGSGILYNKAGTILLRTPEGKTGVLDLESKIFTGIAAGAFADCASITSLKLPDTVGAIGSGAFSGWIVSQTISLKGCVDANAIDVAVSSTDWRQDNAATISDGSI